jgi:crotonobetainyl-CoA:carnitine CoA-transferase CaiB-like acyl-CoA transferase
MYCLSSMADLVNDHHLKERGFWVDIDHPELGARLPYPRRFVHMSEDTPRMPYRAPRIGEHNPEVYREMGLSDHEIVRLRGAGVI